MLKLYESQWRKNGLSQYYYFISFVLLSFQHEVSLCRKEQPYYIRVERSISLVSNESVPMDVGEGHDLNNTSAEDHSEHVMATEPGPSDLSALISHHPKTSKSSHHNHCHKFTIDTVYTGLL